MCRPWWSPCVTAALEQPKLSPAHRLFNTAVRRFPRCDPADSTGANQWCRSSPALLYWCRLEPVLSGYWYEPLNTLQSAKKEERMRTQSAVDEEPCKACTGVANAKGTGEHGLPLRLHPNSTRQSGAGGLANGPQSRCYGFHFSPQ